MILACLISKIYTQVEDNLRRILKLSIYLNWCYSFFHSSRGDKLYDELLFSCNMKYNHDRFRRYMSIGGFYDRMLCFGKEEEVWHCSPNHKY